MNRLTKLVAKALGVQILPDDPKERMRIEAGMLGARGRVTFLRDGEEDAKEQEKFPDSPEQQERMGDYERYDDNARGICTTTGAASRDMPTARRIPGVNNKIQKRR